MLSLEKIAIQSLKLAVALEQHIDDHIKGTTDYLEGYSTDTFHIKRAIKLRELSNKLCDIQSELVEIVEDNLYGN